MRPLEGAVSGLHGKGPEIMEGRSPRSIEKNNNELLYECKKYCA